MFQLELERQLKATGSDLTIDKVRELVKTMYALAYTKPSKVMLRMDDRRQELYRLVENWVNRDLGNA